jgi:hypothetical protein
LIAGKAREKALEVGLVSYVGIKMGEKKSIESHLRADHLSSY